MWVSRWGGGRQWGGREGPGGQEGEELPSVWFMVNLLEQQRLKLEISDLVPLFGGSKGMGCQGQPLDREVGSWTWASQASSLPRASGITASRGNSPFPCWQGVCVHACVRVFAFEANRRDLKPNNR